MDWKQAPPQALEQLFEVGCFCVVNELPIGSEFGIDGSYWVTGPLFQGIKLIPPGFHIITIVPAPSQSPPGQTCIPQDQSTCSGIGQHIRKGLLRFFQQREILIRNYNPETEDLHPSEGDAEESLTSIEYMKSLDSKLAAYPVENYGRWKTLTSWILPEHVQKIFHFDRRGDAMIDSTTCNEIEITGCSKTNVQTGGHLSDEKSSIFKESSISKTNWPQVDLKRSWPKGCIGTELTKWSRDKSWLLDQMIRHQLSNDTNQVLGLMQLSFLTFVHVHSIQSFESYQMILNLLTRSTPQQLYLFAPVYLRMLLQAVSILRAQLGHLDPNFFTNMEDPQIENWFFDIIGKFRSNIHAIKTMGQSIDSNLWAAQMEEVCLHSWPELRSACKAFDWNVRPLRVDRESEDSDSDEDSASEEEDEFKPTIVN